MSSSKAMIRTRTLRRRLRSRSVDPVMLSEVSNILTASAAIFAAWVASAGLKTWKAQKIGTRKIDVAEQLCVDIDRFIKILNDSTQMFMLNFEENEIIENHFQKSPQYLRSNLASAYKPIFRLHKNQDFIESLYDRTHLIYIYFGREGESLINRCRSVHHEIYFAAERNFEAVLAGRELNFRQEEPEIPFIVNMGSSPNSRLYSECQSIREDCRSFFHSILQDDFTRDPRNQSFCVWKFLWG